MTTLQADYIIVGGGLTGCAVASRLRQSDPTLDIVVIEAGADPSGNANTTTPMGGFALAGSDLDYAYQTVPVASTNARVHTLTAGKTLGGGSILNYGGWARGDARDYDQWAAAVGDDRWSYRGLLPYMRRSERFHDHGADPQQHGFDGPMKVTSVAQSDPRRVYPLRGPVKEAWTELGVETNAHPCSGSLAGIAEYLENWDDGIRQPAQRAYALDGVRVLTGTAAHRVLFSHDGRGPPVAAGVQLADGCRVGARREIVVAAGALRTPQVLLLSGIGPAAALARHGIPLVHDAPGVGANLFDHFALFQVWRLRHAERGLALGSPQLRDPAFVKGLAVDWAVNEAVPAAALLPALERDGAPARHPLLEPGRSHVETLVVYSPMAPGVPVDGRFIATSVMLLLPTSRGCVTLASADPADPPAIDPNYFATHADRAVLVHGARRVAHALTATAAGASFVEAEAPPPGMPPLTAASTDAEIEERIRAAGIAHFHPAGTAAMGSVVDAELRVHGLRGLRVADASVLPVPIGGHPQATLYALAEQAAVMIARDAK